MSTRAERLAAEARAYAIWDNARPDCCGKKMVWQPADGTYYCPKCKERVAPKEPA